MKPSPELITQTLDALERLMRMFTIERFLYLACSAVSFILLLYCLVVFFRDSDGINLTQLSLIFGSSGLIAASAMRISYFFNKSFDLISDVVRALADMDEGNAGENRAEQNRAEQNRAEGNSDEQ